MMTEEYAIAWALAFDAGVAAEFEKLNAAHLEWTKASKISFAIRYGQPGFWQAEAARKRTANKLGQLQHRRVTAFAHSRGWKVYQGRRGWITVRQLVAGRWDHDWGCSHMSVIDHRECFTFNRHPVAILSHTYESWERCVKFAEEHRLIVEQLPYSWYYPGAAIAALFTRGAR
jgi:hypothetical protein